MSNSDRLWSMSFLFAALVIWEPLLAQSPSEAANPRAMIKLRTEGVPPPPATLANVAWYEGHWLGEMPEGPVEQVNLGPQFGQMPGFVRAVNPQGVIFYEITVLVEVGNSLTVRVKHFTPQLAGWEARDAYIDRPLVARDVANLYFDGITISRTGVDSYVVYFLNRSGAEERDTIVVPFRRIREPSTRKVDVPQGPSTATPLAQARGLQFGEPGHLAEK